MNKKLTKKGISEIVSVTLLLLVTMLVFFSLQNWYYSYINNDVINTIDILDDSVEILLINSSNIYIKNNNNVPIEITSIEIEGNECTISGILEVNDINIFSTSNCPFTIYKGKNTVFINTPSSIVSNNVIIQNQIN